MDKFDEEIRKLKNLSAEDQAGMIDNLKNMCLCPGCPTYSNCMKGNSEKIYCLKGKSACNVTKKACYCPTCPVTDEIGLTMTFYCAAGSEQGRRQEIKFP